MEVKICVGQYCSQCNRLKWYPETMISNAFSLFSVRATSVLCLLGLGLGLGSLLVYRFCARLFNPTSRTKASSIRNTEEDKAIVKKNGTKEEASCRSSSRVISLPIAAVTNTSGSDSEKISPEVCVYFKAFSFGSNQ